MVFVAERLHNAGLSFVVTPAARNRPDCDDHTGEYHITIKTPDTYSGELIPKKASDGEYTLLD